MSYLSSSDKVGRGNIDNNSFQLYDMYDNNILKNDTRQGRNKIKEIRKKILFAIYCHPLPCKHKCFGCEKANLINIKRGFKDRGSQRVQRWTKENDGRVLCPQLHGTLIRLFGNAFLIHDEP